MPTARNQNRTKRSPAKQPAGEMPVLPRRRWASSIEVADYLGITTRTVRTMIADGRLRAYRNGPRLIRLDLNEVDASLTAMGE